jgi:hypothetical protein
MLQVPTSVTPGEALATIALWNGVTMDELHSQIQAGAPANATPEQARIQFVLDYVCRLWEDWYHLELSYTHRVG